MWVLYALGSAFFAGITAILVKCGIEKTDATVATAVRTVVVAGFAWLMAFLAESPAAVWPLSPKTWIFLILSGLATGGSWLCYFKALQLGDVNKVVPIDKSSIVLTMVGAIVFFHEPCSWGSLTAMGMIACGTWLMIQKKPYVPKLRSSRRSSWLLYAVLSAVFACLTTILGKIGIENVESNWGTAIRTMVVLAMAWLVVVATGKQQYVHNIPKRELFFIALSGVATGGSWLCYYKALQDGLASVVVSIDQLSILVSITFSWLVFKESLSKTAKWGLALITAGSIIVSLHVFN